MAFMMPVMKNEFDIYKGSGKSRRISECSNNSNCRSRKISECSRSECPSLSTSPGSDFVPGSPAHRSHPMQMHRITSKQFSRSSSRNSQSSLITSPTKSSAGSSPPKPASSESTLSFHTRLVDKLRKSLRRGKSNEDRSWGGAKSSTPPPQMPTHSRLSDIEIGYSDSVLHKPPLPHTAPTVSTPKTIKNSASKKFRSLFGSSSAPR